MANVIRQLDRTSELGAAQFAKVLLRRNVKRFRGGLVFKAHRLLYHSTLGWRVIKKKREEPPIPQLGPDMADCGSYRKGV